jgi:NodT family efflux transporter outer membrane factor (OMF) lipoprotein
VASFTSLVARDRNALNALVGSSVPAELLPTKAASDQSGLLAIAAAQPAASVLLAVPADLSSQVLLRRPDVAAAEFSLRGTYASIGAARAAFFPSISLTASVGTGSNALSGLFESGSGSWSFIPQIRLPIFDAGRNQSNLEVAEANQGIAVAQYEKVVQTAFREVADAFADRATLAQRLAAQTSLMEATQRTFTLSDARFKAGVDNYLTVLDAQRSLYAAQQTLIGLQLAEQANRITLYKVLGGG